MANQPVAEILGSLFADHVRAARDRLGWSVAYLSRASGVKVSALNRFEAGQGDLQHRSLSAVCSVLEQAGVEFTGDGLWNRLGETWTLAAAQLKAARCLLGWTQDRLGATSEVPGHWIAIYERTGKAIGDRIGTPPSDRLAAIRAALEAAGVEFIEQNGSGPGVRLRGAR